MKFNNPKDATEDEATWIKDGEVETKAKVIYTDKLELCKAMRSDIHTLVALDRNQQDNDRWVVKGERFYAGTDTVIGKEGFGFAKDGDRWLRIPHIRKVIIGDDVEIGSNCCIDRGCLTDTVIGNGVKIDNLCHIAHGVVIGDNTIITAGTIIAGSVTIGKNVWIAPNSTIKNGVTIGDNAFIGMASNVLKDVPAGETWCGNPARKL
jgi:UDP-3-O-[3-hydroxymyristoyl] glucosamine N-acyltransferase